MNPIVGIIGINGRYGAWLERFFRSLDCIVIGSDLDTEFSNRQVVEQADVVIFSVLPIATATDLMEGLARFSRPEQLWLDVTSVKSKPMKAMLLSKASVVGLHPVCAPPVELSLKGQTLVVCRGRCSDPWNVWLDQVFEKTAARIEVFDPDDHDRLMMPIQGPTQAGAVLMAMVLKNLKVDVSATLGLASPVYKLGLGLTGRILSQPELYADILTANPYMITVVKELEHQARRLRSMIADGDPDVLSSAIQSAADHFGQANITSSFDLFTDLSRVMSDLSREHSITIEAAEDRPGLLWQISQIFAEEQINLNAVHSFRQSNGVFKFKVGFDCLVGSTEAKRAIARIKELSWVVKVT